MSNNYTLFWSKRCIHCQKLMAHLRSLDKPIGNLVKLQCLDDINPQIFPPFLKEVPALVKIDNSGVDLTVGENILQVILNIPISQSEREKNNNDIMTPVHPMQPNMPSITMKNKPEPSESSTVRQNFGVDEGKEKATLNAPNFSDMASFSSPNDSGFGESLDEAFKPISSGLDKKEVSMDKGDYEKRYQELLAERKM